MNIKYLFVLAAILSVFLFNVTCSTKSSTKDNSNNSFPDLTGEYLGQEPPGTIPEIFASGIISTGRDFAITFSPDGKECFFTRELNTMCIMTTREVNNIWTEPEIAWFSGIYFDYEPHITPNGLRLYFGSRRPLLNEGDPIDMHQWYLEKIGPEWSTPVPLGSPFLDIFVMYVSLTNDNSIYFTGQENGDGCIFVSRYINGNYLEPEKLSDNINFRRNAAHPFIAPDESYLIYDAVQNNTGNGGYISDLFISFRNEGGTWSISENLGNNINTDGNESCAFVSRDMKYLFFSRDRSIYWVNAGIIEDFRPAELKKILE